MTAATDNKALRAEWLAARERVWEIERIIEAATAPYRTPLQERLEALHRIEERAGGEVLTCCGCRAPIFPDDPRTHAAEDGGCLFCETCSPTWGDMKAEPGWFMNNETGEPHTAETAALLIEKHLAAGGNLSDTMAAAPGKGGA